MGELYLCCLVTKNPVGTDTRPIGHPCKCQVCQAADKIDGLEADLENAVETAFKRGAVEWTRLNYPKLYARLAAAQKDQPL